MDKGVYFLANKKDIWVFFEVSAQSIKNLTKIGGIWVLLTQ
jgi:hypothetical protein